MIPDAVIHSRLLMKADKDFSLETSEKQVQIWTFQDTHLLTHGKLLPFKMLARP